ncbi:MAG: PTS galactitol transporter subunit IIC [Spirochaetales bacterium]|nr:PTS galactitol transporter subunit IIC [Spirochaetales bacterium]
MEIGGLQTVVGFFLGLGASVLLPIILFILSLVFGAKPGKSIRSALMFGVGFIGLNLVIGLLSSNIGPVSQSMVSRFGLQYDIIDVGWPACASIAFGSKISTLIIPAGILLNLLLIFTKVTKTINIDIWNYWHFAFVGGLVQWATGNIWYGLISALIFSAAMLYLADWTGPAIQQTMKLPGISIPHGFSAAPIPFAILINKIIDLIPGLRDVKGDPETVKKKFGLMGEPLIMGVVIGLVLSGVAYIGVGPWTDWLGKMLSTGVSLGAVMVLMPRMVSLLMEGLIPLSDAARDFLQKKSGDREIYIGLDSAVIVGHPTAIATGLVMVPITLILAIILPGNKVIPFGDLAVLPFLVCMVIPIVKANVFRSIVISTVFMIPSIYIMNFLAEGTTAAAVAADFALPEGANLVTSICDGGNWIPALFLALSNNFWIGNIAVVAVLAVLWWRLKKNPAGWHKLAGYEAEKVEK